VGDAVTWVAFTDQAAFHTYHDAVCAQHGIPHPGRDEDTGALDVFAQWTVAWVAPVDDAGTIKAQVPDEDVDTYGLTPTDPAGEDSTAVTWDYTKDPGERIAEGDPSPTRETP
jgi:hypothetical protein